MIDDPFAAALRELDVSSQHVVDALRAALTGSGRGGAGDVPTAERASFEPINWAAYSHEELYRMLRDRADSGEVGAIAAEWNRHADALTGHADAVRAQRGALTAHWRGEAAERAAGRIGELAELIGAIGERARLVGRAAQESADALDLARRTMPLPVGGQVALPDVGDSGVVFAVGAVAAGGTSAFRVDALAGSGRERAVEVMRGYEASLHGSGALIAPPVRATSGGTGFVGVAPGGAVGVGEVVDDAPGAGQQVVTSLGATVVSAASGGVPWARLLHADLPATGAPPPAPGAPALRAVITQLPSGHPVTTAQSAPLGNPPLPALPQHAPDAEPRAHKRRQPDVVAGLFDDDRPATRAVIGDAAWDADRGRRA
ncbi:PPE family [Actinosynnema pretiosum]|nr:PPE family [Actinosynnema pretiosum]